MIVEKPTLVCCAASLVFALGFGFFAYTVLPKTGLSYGIVSVDPSYSDRELRSLLMASGIEQVISESSQRVFYDDFGGVKAVPLDQYREHIDSLDPRDDGYAEKLRSAFYGEAGRFLFLPSGSGFLTGTPAALRKKLSRILDGIPHSFTVEGFPRPLIFPLVVFAVSSSLMLFLFRARRVFVFALPLLGALAWFGVPGFGLAALLCLMFYALFPPMEEWIRGSGLLWKGLFIKHLAAAALLGLLWTALFIVSGIPFPLIVLLPLALFLGWLSLWRRKALARRLGHTRFIPLSIIPEEGPFRESFQILLPFALGAVFMFVFPLFVQGINAYHKSEMRKEMPVTRSDFENHLSFQRSFSSRPLGAPERGQDYGVYTLDSDGLIGAFIATPRDAGMPRISPEDTALFTLLENPGPPVPVGGLDLLWTAGLFVLLIPARLLRGGTRQGAGASVRCSDKRIAA
jgi:hypothetical protein